MTDRDLMQQALDALETICGLKSTNLDIPTAMQALRARLAQLEACIVKGCSNHRVEGLFVGALCSPCHTFITTGEGKYSQAYRNSQREWQGLTNEELDQAMDYWSDPSRSAYGGAHWANGEYVDMKDTWRYIEAKLKEKNT